jgi:hypothetical protein
MRSLLILAALAVTPHGCHTARDGYPIGSPQEAEQIQTKEEMLEQYGVPSLALPEQDHWLYVYRSSITRGLEVGFGPGGLLGGVAYDHSTSDVLQFRVDREGRVLSVTPLFAVPEAEYRLWPTTE